MPGSNLLPVFKLFLTVCLRLILKVTAIALVQTLNGHRLATSAKKQINWHRIMNAINIFQWPQREHPAADSEQQPWCTWMQMRTKS